MADIIKKIRKIKKISSPRLKYLKYYNKLKIDDKTILLESQHGSNINGNIFYILFELVNNKDYKDYKIYVTVKKQSLARIKKLLKSYNINCNFVEINSKEYYKIISSAKYLINDTTFLPFFIKKEGQIYLNTWHGTPLKAMGRGMNSDYHNIGNVQKNFLVADYLLYPNEFTLDVMTRDYMIDNLTSAKYILTEYPRNEGLVWNNKNKIKEELNLVDKKIYTYMPTWRGIVSKIDNKANIYLQYYLYELDKKLNDDEIMFVNLHPMAQKNIDFQKFTKIKSFPSEYETYDFLKISDVLVTDYSSVMFDFLQTNKKCVLFVYDKDEYLADRGLYIDLDALPFKQVVNIEALIEELRSPFAGYSKKELEMFIPYDAKDTTKHLLDRVIKNKKNDIKVLEPKRNGKDNVLIFVGNLAKNGITTSIKALLNSIDLTKRNYFITFDAKAANNYASTLKELPIDVNYVSIMGQTNLSLFQKLILILYHLNFIKYSLFLKFMKKPYTIEKERIYGKAKFSDVIHFTGYGYKKITLFALFDSNKIIFDHSNMVEEIKHKRTKPRKRGIVYKMYDKVAVVTKDIITPTKQLMEKEDYHKITIVNNIIDIEGIIAKSKGKIIYDEDTISNVSNEELINILENPDNIKYINIGRFSAEKGHIRLINAFNKLWEKNKDAFLIIIGGHGNKFNETLEYADSFNSRKNIIIIKSISNPLSILKKCDCFVLSSFHEGFGLVLVEADLLNIPVISTDILGPKLFLEEYGGKIVENSEEGLYQGMIEFLENKLKTMSVDYKKYNKQAIDSFEKLFEKRSGKNEK